MVIIKEKVGFMKKIYITGDTHGVLDFKKLQRFSHAQQLDRTDYIIIAGDCGVVWARESISEYISIFESLGATILFIDGNHENFDLLEVYSEVEFCGGKVHKISDNIYHLCRGEIFNLYGKKILAFGGGESNDMKSRIEHKTWWRQESVTSQDFENAKVNLNSCGNKVDYVVSHVPPTQILSLIEKDLTCCGEELPWYMVPKLISKTSNNIVQELSESVEFEKWFFGHIHLDVVFDKFVGVYENVLELN